MTRSDTRRFVTLHSEKGTAVVELPGDAPLAELLPDLAKALGLALPPHKYIHLQNVQGLRLSETQTLIAASVENSDHLWLAVGDQIAREPNGESSEAPAPQRAFESAEREIAVDAPSLVSPNGFIFVLGEPPISIGRASRDHKPAIDLSELDPGLAAARRHATIEIEGKTFILTPEATKNGTFLNNHEAPAGARVALVEGDEIQFGFKGPKLIFRVG